MAPRSIATGTISFGLVSIPVRLYPASQSAAAVSFNLLHARCGTRVKQQYVCPRDGEKVEREEMVKGYEVAKDRWVTFTAEELAALDEIATQTIDIAEFVSIADVDPLFFDGAYHLGPDRGGAKAYRLLALALERAGKAALARYAARGKQYLVLIRARGGRLVLQQLHYRDELRPPEEIPVDDAEVKDAELQLALALVEQATADGFHPERYEDTVKQRVLEAIARKVAGQQITAAAPVEPQAQVIDLLDALKASLQAPRGRADGRDAGSDAGRKADAQDGTPEERRRGPRAAPRPGGGERARTKAAPTK
jgi:DNA end-binding protein Ku